MAERVLLDTHTFVWWVAGSSELSKPAAAAIRGAERVDVSLVTLWELVLKESTTHPMVGSDDVGGWFGEALGRTGFDSLGIEASHLAAVQQLPAHHGDPFDRLLVAQAQALGAAIVTRDRAIRRYDVPTIW